jgi:hypothetical protein
MFSLLLTVDLKDWSEWVVGSHCVTKFGLNRQEPGDTLQVLLTLSHLLQALSCMIKAVYLLQC